MEYIIIIPLLIAGIAVLFLKAALRVKEVKKGGKKGRREREE